tara:strand:+ start:956 stop:1096 length:141 start_codon:yes stop_codon:yes gene_type:complete
MFDKINAWEERLSISHPFLFGLFEAVTISLAVVVAAVIIWMFGAPL